MSSSSNSAEVAVWYKDCTLGILLTSKEVNVGVKVGETSQCRKISSGRLSMNLAFVCYFAHTCVSFCLQTQCFSTLSSTHTSFHISTHNAPNR